MKSIFRDQSGAALVIGLIMMIVITLIGLASTYTSIFEIKLSGNKRGITDAFYTADAGLQSSLATVTNFNTSTYTAVADTTTLPQSLRHESIDSFSSAPVLSLPAGVAFTDPPQVTLYHTGVTGAPRGTGMSATGNMEYQYYIVQSTGEDQIDSSLVKSTCQVRQKVVRLIPTAQGGN